MSKIILKFLLNIKFLVIKHFLVILHILSSKIIIFEIIIILRMKLPPFMSLTFTTKVNHFSLESLKQFIILK